MSIIENYLTAPQQESLAQALHFAYASPIDTKALHVIDQLYRDFETTLPKSRRRKVRLIQRETHRDPNNKILEIILTGDWLHAAGFNPGSYARIFALNGVLVICCEENTSPHKYY